MAHIKQGEVEVGTRAQEEDMRNITSALQHDLGTAIEEFVSKGCMRFPSFRVIWARRRLSLIHHSCPSRCDRDRFLQLAFSVILDTIKGLHGRVVGSVSGKVLTTSAENTVVTPSAGASEVQRAPNSGRMRVGSDCIGEGSITRANGTRRSKITPVGRTSGVGQRQGQNHGQQQDLGRDVRHRDVSGMEGCPQRHGRLHEDNRSLVSSLSPAQPQSPPSNGESVIKEGTACEKETGTVPPVDTDPSSLVFSIGALFALYTLHGTQLKEPPLPIRVDSPCMVDLLQLQRCLLAAGARAADACATFARLISERSLVPAAYSGPPSLNYLDRLCSVSAVPCSMEAGVHGTCKPGRRRKKKALDNEDSWSGDKLKEETESLIELNLTTLRSLGARYKKYSRALHNARLSTHEKNGEGRSDTPDETLDTSSIICRQRLGRRVRMESVDGDEMECSAGARIGDGRPGGKLSTENALNLDDDIRGQDEEGIRQDEVRGVAETGTVVEEDEAAAAAVQALAVAVTVASVGTGSKAEVGPGAGAVVEKGCEGSSCGEGEDLGSKETFENMVARRRSLVTRDLEAILESVRQKEALPGAYGLEAIALIAPPPSPTPALVSAQPPACRLQHSGGTNQSGGPATGGKTWGTNTTMRPQMRLILEQEAQERAEAETEEISDQATVATTTASTTTWGEELVDGSSKGGLGGMGKMGSTRVVTLTTTVASSVHESDDVGRDSEGGSGNGEEDYEIDDFAALLEGMPEESGDVLGESEGGCEIASSSGTPPRKVLDTSAAGKGKGKGKGMGRGKGKVKEKKSEEKETYHDAAGSSVHVPSGKGKGALKRGRKLAEAITSSAKKKDVGGERQGRSQGGGWGSGSGLTRSQGYVIASHREEGETTLTEGAISASSEEESDEEMDACRRLLAAAAAAQSSEVNARVGLGYMDEERRNDVVDGSKKAKTFNSSRSNRDKANLKVNASASAVKLGATRKTRSRAKVGAAKENANGDGNVAMQEKPRQRKGQRVLESGFWGVGTAEQLRVSVKRTRSVSMDGSRESVMASTKRCKVGPGPGKQDVEQMEGLSTPVTFSGSTAADQFRQVVLGGGGRNRVEEEVVKKGVEEGQNEGESAEREEGGRESLTGRRGVDKMILGQMGGSELELGGGDKEEEEGEEEEEVAGMVSIDIPETGGEDGDGVRDSTSGEDEDDEVLVESQRAFLMAQEVMKQSLSGGEEVGAVLPSTGEGGPLCSSLSAEIRSTPDVVDGRGHGIVTGSCGTNRGNDQHKRKGLSRGRTRGAEMKRKVNSGKDGVTVGSDREEDNKKGNRATGPTRGVSGSKALSGMGGRVKRRKMAAGFFGTSVDIASRSAVLTAKDGDLNPPEVVATRASSFVGSDISERPQWACNNGSMGASFGGEARSSPQKGGQKRNLSTIQGIGADATGVGGGGVGSLQCGINGETDQWIGRAPVGGSDAPGGGTGGVGGPPGVVDNGNENDTLSCGGEVYGEGCSMSAQKGTTKLPRGSFLGGLTEKKSGDSEHRSGSMGSAAVSDHEEDGKLGLGRGRKAGARVTDGSVGDECSGTSSDSSSGDEWGMGEGAHDRLQGLAEALVAGQSTENCNRQAKSNAQQITQGCLQGMDKGKESAEEEEGNGGNEGGLSDLEDLLNSSPLNCPEPKGSCGVPEQEIGPDSRRYHLSQEPSAVEKQGTEIGKIDLDERSVTNNTGSSSNDDSESEDDDDLLDRCADLLGVIGGGML